MSIKGVWSWVLTLSALVIVSAILAPIDDISGDGFFRFIGRFHVLVLHFPVVLLLLAPAFDYLARKPKYKVLADLSLLLWIGGIVMAIVTVLLGLTLAANEGYTIEHVATHRNAGVAVAILALFAFGLRQTKILKAGKLIDWAQRGMATALVLMIFVAAHAGGNLVHGNSYLTKYAPGYLKSLLESNTVEQAPSFVVTDKHFAESVQPVLGQYCYECHNADKQKGGLRLDIMNPDMLQGRDAPRWHNALNMMNRGEMPPRDETQLTNEDRRLVINWLTETLDEAAKMKKANTQVVMRRLTKEQYTNSLQDVLGMKVNFGDTLPDDAKSGLGFTNDGSALQASSLHLDYFQNIARDALNKAVAPAEKPEVSHYKVTFGAGLGKGQVAGGKVVAYQEVSVHPDDFKIDIMDADGKIIHDDSAERKAELDEIRKKISVGMRGSSRTRFHMVDEGMILYAALPHKEVAPKSWQGPSPNLKMQMQRIFPQEGDFRMEVTASKGYFPDLVKPNFIHVFGLSPKIELAKGEDPLFQSNAQVLTADAGYDLENVQRSEAYLVPTQSGAEAQVLLKLAVEEAGFYQLDIVRPVAAEGDVPEANVSVDGIGLSQRFGNDVRGTGDDRRASAIGVAFMKPGEHEIEFDGRFFAGFSHVVVTPYSESHPEIALLTPPETDEQKRLMAEAPILKAYIGTFLDDGMDYDNFGESKLVETPFGDAQKFTFSGRLENMPIPEADTGDTEPLSGIMVLGLWNDNLVKSTIETGPPLLIQSIEFEAPFIPEWPAKSHKNIFVKSEHASGSEAYTRQILERFMSKAFRRPAKEAEVNRYLDFWQSIKGEFNRYEDSVKETLVAVLSSPNFLFLAEPLTKDMAPSEAMVQKQLALVSRLSYFLWDSPPDETLRSMASAGQIEANISDVVDRMLEDPRAMRFVKMFTRQWIRLDRAEAVAMDADKYPTFTRFVKDDLQEETYQFIAQILKEDLSIMTMIDSDFAMLNQNLAEYYGIDGVRGNNFRSVKLSADQGRGGLLTQGAFLSGHSSGVEAHTVKRAVWFREKMLGNPPPPPPPNVPELDPESPGFENLSLKDQLAKHRNLESCRDCHLGIDPYGIVFEGYDAGGHQQTMSKGRPIDVMSILPDGTEVVGVDGIKNYLLGPKKDEFAMSVIKHLFSYSLGRDISYTDDRELAKILQKTKDGQYRFRSVIKAIVTSADFMKSVDGEISADD